MTLAMNLAGLLQIAVAQGRGKAQADTLRKAKQETTERKLTDGHEERVPGPMPWSAGVSIARVSYIRRYE